MSVKIYRHGNRWMCPPCPDCGTAVVGNCHPLLPNVVREEEFDPKTRKMVFTGKFKCCNCGCTWTDEKAPKT